MSRSISLVALVVSCSQAFEPSEWESFDPPKAYRSWHQEVEACTGLQRSFQAIQWRKVYATTFLCPGLEEAAGCFIHPRTIYLVETYLDQEWLVKAELIHYVRHDTSHDELFYQCGGR